MSKNSRNHDAYFRHTSSESDDEICITKEISHSHNRGQCSQTSERSVTVSSSSSDETDILRKARNTEDSSEYDTDEEIEKHVLKIEQLFKRKLKKRKFIEDRKGTYSSIYMDGLNECEAERINKITARKRYSEDIPEFKTSKRRMPMNFGKYPKVPFGVIRRKVRDESFIQSDVARDFPPCPGLEHITEIRGLHGLSYFCNFCQALCQKQDILHHLKGRRHQLNCLRSLRPDEYQNLPYVHKENIRNFIFKKLDDIQVREGIGRITVEKEYFDKDNCGSEKKTSLQALGIPSTSSGNPSRSYLPGTASTSTSSDFSKSEYFCVICEVNMTDVALWESHTKGRFCSSVKKGREAKIIAVPMPQCDAFLVDRVGVSDGPIVGLDLVREIQHEEEKKETYHCFLCRKCLTCIDILQHVTSLKHRINYLEHINHHSLDLVRGLDLDGNKSYYIIEEICRKLQKDVGSGQPEIYVVKSSKE